MKHLPKLRSLGRGALVGAAATAVDLLSLGVLVHLVGASPRLASPVALLAGALVQFVGSKRFTFQDRSRAWAQQAAAFGLVELGALLLHAVGFEVIVIALGAPPLLGRVLVGALVYGGFSWPLWSLVFRPSPARVAAPVLEAAEGCSR